MNKQPALISYIEHNQKYGHGYQGRLVMDGVIDSVVDDEPFTLDEVYSGMVSAIEEINKARGYNYDPYTVIRITGAAVKANKKHDFASARIARDMQEGKGELVVPLPDKPDICYTEVDGQQEAVLSGRGVILMIYNAMCDMPKNPFAVHAMLRYCNYLTLHGYGKPTHVIFSDIMKKDKESARNWITATYARYVSSEADLINYVTSGYLGRKGI